VRLLASPHRARLARVLAIDCFLAYWFLLDRVAAVRFITPVGKNIKWNLRAVRSMRRMADCNEAIWPAQPLF
jgi:hypothetical protein